MSNWSGSSKVISEVCSIDDIQINEFKLPQNELFGIIGGPPCQDFSIRGSRNGFDGLRGTVTYHFYEKIIDLHPDFFLMENVPGLVLLKKTKKSFEVILDLFKEEYQISTKRLNSLHYGVPQSRERLFVFGIKKSLLNESLIQERDNWFDWPIPIYPNAEKIFKWGEPTNKGLNENELPLPPVSLCVENYLIDNVDDNAIPNSREYFKLQNPKKVQLIAEGDTYRPSFKKLHRRKYSPTVCYGNNEVHLHPTKNRRLSVREALRLQGVPESYVLETSGKLSKKFKMIGNGVPVPLAHHIAKAIGDFLNRKIIRI
jgi:DNA (cytosine-5)-methyltransferase 1